MALLMLFIVGLALVLLLLNILLLSVFCLVQQNYERMTISIRPIVERLAHPAQYGVMERFN
jgi:hypothetical protein